MSSFLLRTVAGPFSRYLSILNVFTVKIQPSRRLSNNKIKPSITAKDRANSQDIPSRYKADTEESIGQSRYLSYGSPEYRDATTAGCNAEMSALDERAISISGQRTHHNDNSALTPQACRTTAFKLPHRDIWR